MAKRRSPICRGRGGGISLGLSRLNPKVSKVGTTICENWLQLSDNVDPLNVPKEGEAAKARAVARLKKFHEAATDFRRKTKEMNGLTNGLCLTGSRA